MFGSFYDLENNYIIEEDPGWNLLMPKLASRDGRAAALCLRVLVNIFLD